MGRPLREGVGRNVLLRVVQKVHKAVALYARAWVEITRSPNLTVAWLCRPLREGVGRNPVLGAKNGVVCVALYARAWVEMLVCDFCEDARWVALYARAWVEITFSYVSNIADPSPSTRGRG